MMPFETVRKNLRIMGDNLAGPLRRHAQPHHHAPIDAYVGFIGKLLDFITQLEKQMTTITQALTKVEGQRDAWKTYAQAQKTKADQSDRARQAAEDKLAALPFLPDAEDAANVNGVLSAADDLPPADTTPTPEPVPTPEPTPAQ